MSPVPLRLYWCRLSGPLRCVTLSVGSGVGWRGRLCAGPGWGGDWRNRFVQSHATDTLSLHFAQIGRDVKRNSVSVGTVSHRYANRPAFAVRLERSASSSIQQVHAVHVLVARRDVHYTAPRRTVVRPPSGARVVSALARRAGALAAVRLRFQTGASARREARARLKPS